MVRQGDAWDKSHMRKKRESTIDIERVVAALEQLIATAPEKRDHYDRQIQAITGTKGKPIYDIIRGKNKNPSAETINLIAKVLGTPVTSLVPDMPSSNAGSIVNFQGASLESPKSDLPIHGTAMGAVRMVDGEAIEQTELNRGDIVGYARRPSILDGKKDAYALYVQGGSMFPAFPDGDMIVAQKGQRLHVGDNVVVYLRMNGDDDDGERARCVLVKCLVRRSASFIELEQYDPRLTFRVDMDDVLRIDRVLTRAEMLS